MKDIFRAVELVVNRNTARFYPAEELGRALLRAAKTGRFHDEDMDRMPMHLGQVFDLPDEMIIEFLQKIGIGPEDFPGLIQACKEQGFDAGALVRYLD